MRATIRIDTLPGAEAAIGQAGGRVLVVDRPEGRAGGMGLGFNGVELLGLAVGGSLRQRPALRGPCGGRGARPDRDRRNAGPRRRPSARVGPPPGAACETTDGSDPAALAERVRATSMAMNSVTWGLPVMLRAGGAVPD